MGHRIGIACIGILIASLGLKSARVDAADTSSNSSGSVARRVKVLFLGDNGHHVPLERCRDAYSLLGKRGIDLVYTDDLNDLNPSTLGRYDVLLL